MDTQAEDLRQRPGCGSPELLMHARLSEVSYIHLHVVTEALFTLIFIYYPLNGRKGIFDWD